MALRQYLYPNTSRKMRVCYFMPKQKENPKERKAMSFVMSLKNNPRKFCYGPLLITKDAGKWRLSFMTYNKDKNP